MGDYSSFLFATPSFFEGMGRILDFGDTMTEFNRSPSPKMADEAAMRADWTQVGQDLMEAGSEYPLASTLFGNRSSATNSEMDGRR